jgi:alpha-N-acetylglucosamine transferase
MTEYDRVLFLDSEATPLKNLDYLIDLTTNGLFEGLKLLEGFDLVTPLLEMIPPPLNITTTN